MSEQNKRDAGFFANMVEDTIKIISPKLGAVRSRNRYIGEIYAQKRHYEGASNSRRTAGWIAPGTSANAEIGAALVRLRDRSRDLTRNNVFAGRAVRGITRNVIGSGIVPTPDFPDGSAIEKIIKDAWKDWARDKDQADINERKTFYGIQRLVMRTVVESGECLVIRKRKKGQFIPFGLMVVEADYIDHSKNQELNNGGRIIQGVEVDGNGTVVAYWLFDQHPGEAITFGAIISKRIPRADILHIYREDRAGQLRGVPFGASCFIKLKDFDEYDDAQLVRQKIAACFAAFVYDSKTDALSSIGKTGGDAEQYEKLEPGIIEYLPPGKDVKFGTPPNMEGYKDYSSVSLHTIAAGFDVPYELLTTDLSEVNYSSARMGWLEFQRSIDDIQQDVIIPNLLDPVWRWFIDGLKMQGVIPKGEKIPTTWTPPRREMVDPSKEIKATIEAIRGGLVSWSDAVRELGYDPEELIREIKKDFDKFQAEGIVLECDPRNEKKPGSVDEEIDNKIDKKTEEEKGKKPTPGKK